MKFKISTYLILFFTSFLVYSQNKIDLKASFDMGKKEIHIFQTIHYQNTTQDTLKTIYLHNWANAYANKKTPLALRIADEFDRDFHLAKQNDRGFSEISSIKQNQETIPFEPLNNQIDILKVELKNLVKPNEYYAIELSYTIKIPNSKFTSYGFTESGDFNLRYWYITPAIYDGEWHYYSNLNLDDLYIPKSDINLEISYPNHYTLNSELDFVETSISKDRKVTKLSGKNRINSKLFLSKESKFIAIEGEKTTLESSIEEDALDIFDKVLISNKVLNFISKNLEDYPHKKLLISQIDHKKNPVYGLNFLPKFIKPYPSHFQYELALLNTALQNYLENTLLINPRKDQWLVDGIKVFYLMNYIDEHYPNTKFLGSITDFWGVKSFHAARMTYNEKYHLGYMLMARTHMDQPLTMAKDSLLKFNYNIASKYKAGLGLKYLDDFIENNILETIIEDFLHQYKLEYASTKDFETFIKSKTNKNVDWFFEDYLSTRKKIDFKIRSVSKTKDSVTLTIKNKRDNSMPISLYGLKNDSIVSKFWVENIDINKSITIPRYSANKLVLNYEKVIPELNLRDNWKSLKGFYFNNKPLQFRLFEDIEDPNYNQVFFMPLIEFNNIYDGLTLGVRTYNKTFLRKRLSYQVSPKYSLNSESLTGSVSGSMTHYFDNTNLYAINYGASAGYSSYAQDLFVRKISPSLIFYFRENENLRSNKSQYLRFRYIDIYRDKDLNNLYSDNQPNYSIFNARYSNSNANLINFNSWYTDFQYTGSFSKLGFNYEYRRLFESNRQLNLRLYSGYFIENRNSPDSDFFSFALDRPTDYLFEYAYLGRSESSGIYSQQYIEAEGGFKSKLNTPFANQWIATLNASTTLWNYVLVYGDIGFVKNKFSTPNFVYDSGIRLNLVTDYFEVYFPIYSNLGWEVAQSNYDQKIRFKFTLDPKVILGLFRRKWF